MFSDEKKPWEKTESQEPNIFLHAGPKQPEKKRGPPAPPKPHKYRKPRKWARERYIEYDNMFAARLQKCEEEQKAAKLPWRIDVSMWVMRC